MEVAVVGVDGSEAGSRAAEFAARHVRDASAQLVVVYVIPWSPYSVQTPEENERRHVTKKQEIATAWEEVVQPLLDRLQAEGTVAEGLVKHGHPAEVLCDIARERGARHLVVGRRGQSRVRALLFGSTPVNLIQMADVPVTVVP
jgi:nucleotide-binding universal stress UspA family protein